MGDTGGTPRWLDGCFLVSDFDLVDPNFHRAVVLMIDHDEEGAFGLVVNRPSLFWLLLVGPAGIEPVTPTVSR